MAVEKQKKYQNCKPNSSTNKESTLKYTIKVAETDEDDNVIWVDGGERSIDGIIKNVWNEVNSFSGTDSEGQELKAITNGVRCENMFRYNILSPTDDWNEDDDPNLTSSELLSSYVYTQGVKEVLDNNKTVGYYEYYCRPEYTYEEEYFQHIFNWPTTHTTKERKLAALLEEKIDTYTSSAGETIEECVIESEYAYYDITTTYASQNLTLQKVQSKLYYIDSNWNYQELFLNDDGSINSTGVDVGNSFIYHGGTDDRRKLFFNYQVGSGEIGTTQVVGIGDSIGGNTVTNVVNYVVDVAVVRNASTYPQKRTESKGFLSSSDSGYSETKSWIKVSSIADIQVGDKVWGEGIAENTYVTSIDLYRNIVYISKTIRKSKVKQIYFRNNSVNNVNKTTLCYAELSSDANFTADQVIGVTRNGQSIGVNIIARAGAGIINRSAIVGTYFSSGKKQVEYVPIFYGSSNTCEKIEIEDENAKYVLSTVIYDDNSRDSGVYTLVSPKSNELYQIASMYLSVANGPPDKELTEDFLKFYNENSKDYIKTLGYIKSTATAKLNGRRVAGIFDDTCGDRINLDYNKVYFPVEELSVLNKIKEDTNTGLENADICYPYTPESKNPTLEEQKEKIKVIVDTAVRNTTLLNQEYYNKLIADEDSLINRINNGLEISNKAYPEKTKVDNLPPVIEGEDSSGRKFIVNNYRDIPPALDRVKFYLNDLLIGTEEDFNPTLNLDPATTRNQPKIIISSVPVWSGANDYQFVGTYSETEVTIDVTVNETNFNGVTGIETITSSISGPTPAVIETASGLPIGYPPELIGSPDCDKVVRTYTLLTPNNDSDNILKDHKKDFSSGGYVTGTNWHVHPDLRDLDNKVWPDDPSKDNDENDHLQMTGTLHPKIIWRPNVNYQQDYHKMFWFRPNEVADLIGQSIANFGNPFTDDPVTAKIIKDIKPSDTTLYVNSTDGFLSSGYLIIPKYVKKFYTVETGNENSEFTYFGEEIIYYESKTQTTFENCTRNCFETSTKYPERLNVSQIEVGTRYRIAELGDTDWNSIGVEGTPEVGSVFVATREADTTGNIKIEFLVKWDDNPNDSDIALKSISWAGTNFSFNRPNTEEGKQILGRGGQELFSGNFAPTISGNSGGFRLSGKKKLVFFDKDGTDANTTIEINVKDTFGQNIDVFFNEQGGIVVTGSGAGSGEVTVFGMNEEEIPNPDIIPGIDKPSLVPSISSYDKGHSIAQHWVFRTKED